MEQPPSSPTPPADAVTGELPVVRRRSPVLRAGLLAAVLVMAATGIALAVTDRGPGRGAAAPGSGARPDQPAVPPVGAPGALAPTPAVPPGGGVVSAPLAGRIRSGFDLLDGTSMVTLRTAAIGDDLYRIGTPEGGDVRPQALDRDGRVQLSLVPSGRSGPGAVDITLNARVRWDIRLAGGTQVSVIDLSGGDVGAVELTGGASRIDLTLPRPDGTLTVRMTGGVGEFGVHTTAPVPVRVRVGSGAGRVVLDGRSHAGVPAGELFTPARWDDGGDRIDLDAVAGMSALTVD